MRGVIIGRPVLELLTTKILTKHQLRLHHILIGPVLFVTAKNKMLISWATSLADRSLKFSAARIAQSL